MFQHQQPHPATSNQTFQTSNSFYQSLTAGNDAASSPISERSKVTDPGELDQYSRDSSVDVGSPPPKDISRFGRFNNDDDDNDDDDDDDIGEHDVSGEVATGCATSVYGRHEEEEEKDQDGFLAESSVPAGVDLRPEALPVEFREGGSGVLAAPDRDPSQDLVPEPPEQMEAPAGGRTGSGQHGTRRPADGRAPRPAHVRRAGLGRLGGRHARLGTGRHSLSDAGHCGHKHDVIVFGVDNRSHSNELASGDFSVGDLPSDLFPVVLPGPAPANHDQYCIDKVVNILYGNYQIS